MQHNNADIYAVLGPTNTGKTYHAIERMLSYRTGMIGFPLRLLAREAYDKIVILKGPSVVALLTGEERIVPKNPKYWVSTVEAMPLSIAVDFLAVDEIQLCGDAERGHIFTDRLLYARGQKETMFLGASTIKSKISALIPNVTFTQKNRLSELSFSGYRKFSNIPERSAIVAFSVDQVYTIAELLRRKKGGAAVVMGALSPRIRNAQVALYQNGDVDYLVATDAIGMGLNLDIDHVSFSSVHKFDGQNVRQLSAAELAQIAGRAGRYLKNGSFGITAEVRELDDKVIANIENSNFPSLEKLHYRNSSLSFDGAEQLLASLNAPCPNNNFIKTSMKSDALALQYLSGKANIIDKITRRDDIKLLWDSCQIPDFRNLSLIDHASLIEAVFEFRQSKTGVIDDVWMAKEVNKLDNITGNIDILSQKLAYIRTWTYIAQRNGWVLDKTYWRERARAVEDRVSDALHKRLVERFVDRRTSILLRRLKFKESLVADVNEQGEVSIEGEKVGKLTGFILQLDKNNSDEEEKLVRMAAAQALAPYYKLRADRFYNAPDSEMDITEQGGIMWGDLAIGKLTKGHKILSPEIEVFVDEAAGSEIIEQVKRRTGHFVERRLAALYETLKALDDDEAITGLARGVGFQLVESLGIVPRYTIAKDIAALDQDQRSLLRKHGVRFGQFTIFMPQMLKPAPTRHRLVLNALFEEQSEFPEAPPPGLVTIPAVQGMSANYYRQSGYRLAGERAIRVDMLERLANLIREADTQNGFEATADMLSITGLGYAQFSDLMKGLGYSVDTSEREKIVKPKDAGTEKTEVKEDASGKTVDAEVTEVETDALETPMNESDPTKEVDAPEIETVYTFKWVSKKRPAQKHVKRKPVAKTGGKAGQSKDKSRNSKPKPEKVIDPDNPFAALMALKNKT